MIFLWLWTQSEELLNTKLFNFSKIKRNSNIEKTINGFRAIGNWQFDPKKFEEIFAIHMAEPDTSLDNIWRQKQKKRKRELEGITKTNIIVWFALKRKKIKRLLLLFLYFVIAINILFIFTHGVRDYPALLSEAL